MAATISGTPVACVEMKAVMSCVTPSVLPAGLRSSMLVVEGRTIDGHDDRQADDNFSRRDDHDEERHDLAVNVGVNENVTRTVAALSIGDARRDDRTAAHEDRGRTDGEQHTRRMGCQARLTCSSFFSMGVVVRACERGWGQTGERPRQAYSKAPEQERRACARWCRATRRAQASVAGAREGARAARRPRGRPRQSCGRGHARAGLEGWLLDRAEGLAEIAGVRRFDWA